MTMNLAEFFTGLLRYNLSYKVIFNLAESFVLVDF